jgi:hypothetical protein
MLACVSVHSKGLVCRARATSVSSHASPEQGEALYVACVPCLRLRLSLLLVHLIWRKHALLAIYRNINVVLSLPEECDGIIGRAVRIDAETFDFYYCTARYLSFHPMA